MKKRGKMFLLGTAGLLLLASQAQAGSAPFMFDPTGSGGGNASTISVGAFDWSPSSALAVGAVPVSGGTSFNLFTYASLSNFMDMNADVITGTNLNSTYEITFVAGFGEKTTGVFGPNANFVYDPASNVNFFEIYIDTAKNSDNSLTSGPAGAGTGFNDGTLILSGQITESFDSYTLTTNQSGIVTGLLDQHGTDQLSGQQTVYGVGGGSTGLTALVGIDTIDPNYFPDITSLLGFLVNFNTSLITPFRQVDPATQVWNGSSYITPQLGVINGINGPDFLFQVDANQSMSPVPEPATMMLFGAGLLGLAGISRRKRSNK